MIAPTFGRYQLIKRLAAGGMAEVFLARQSGISGFEKLVVVKRILPNLAESSEFVAMFLQEARTAARLNHPNVVQIFDVGKQDDFYFIAMEYVHGEDVRRVVRQASTMGRILPLPLAIRFCIGACEALEYAHGKRDENGRPLNIVHRDVSPQNILVTFEGGVKVIDFGIAKAADHMQRTRTGVLKGKYSYMSPEQAAGTPVDRRSDVFAVGVILYELCTGQRLFKRATDLSTLNAVSACRVDPPSSRNSAIGTDLDVILLRALSKDREQRTGSCGQLQLELEEYLTKHRLPGSSAHLAPFMREIYAERLAEEARLGVPVLEDRSVSPDIKPGTVTPSPRRPAPPVPVDSPRPISSALPLRARPAALTNHDDTTILARPFRSRRELTGVLGGCVALVAALVCVFLYRHLVSPATLLVSSDPPGATVVVDDGASSGETPVTLSGLTHREHRLTIKKNYFETATKLVRIDGGGDQTPLVVKLVPLIGALEVTTDPPGATVWLDRVVVGRTTANAPLRAGPLAAGKDYRLVIALDGYEDVDESVRFERAQTVPIDRKLKRR